MDLREMAEEKVELQIAPLIDVVFLLLIYFMVSASLKKKETDMAISLPTSVETSEEMDMPDEQIIEIREDGLILLNAMPYGQDGSKYLPDLEETLALYKEASDAIGSPPLVTIAPDDKPMHDRVIDVLNACAYAGIKNISFSMDE